MQWERPESVFARKALTAQGWQHNVLVTIDRAGVINGVQKNAAVSDGTPSFDLLLPGISNVHSHAFQRSMAGFTERASLAGEDNFWSWRSVMYDFTFKFTPEQIETITRALYIDLLRHGYTGVAEFHYLHNDTNGKPYASISELSDRIVAAAQSAGIHLTHLPVLYETANFGGIPAHDGQRCFVHSVDSYLRLLATLHKNYSGTAGVTLGIAPHSLRAVRPESLQTILNQLAGIGLEGCPIHMHIAEQEKEVADCMAWSKQRPVEWLLEHMPVDTHWCLIHATHMTAEETRKLAASGAVTGLCPTTEANLGDGIFPAELYAQSGGKTAIGTDSNVCVSPFEELRLMEYVQRLATRKRNVLHDASHPSVGRSLFDRVTSGGAQALGIRSGQIGTGYRADMLALSTKDALLADKEGDFLLDTLVFALTPDITDVFVAGQRVIANRQHVLQDESSAALQKVMRQLRE